MSQTVGDYLVRRLREWGVSQVFAYPGDGINGIVGALGRSDNQPRFVQSRHEEMAAFSAVGYAKFSGQMGKGDPDAWQMVSKGVRTKMAEFFHRGGSH